MASVAGDVLRVNKLISVRPVQSRYSGDVGDVVIGRVGEVENKQWRVVLAPRHLAPLQLGAINLPGGALRKRTAADNLQMRNYLAENDLVSAEVSAFYQHGGLNIHTRSMRYGKLQNGSLVKVPPSLIKRLNQHFVRLPCGIDAIFAVNGRIWLTAPDGEGSVEESRMTEQMELDKRAHAEREINAKSRLAISRVRNSILLIASKRRLISPQIVTEVYNRSIALEIAPKAMLGPDSADLLLGLNGE